MVIIAVFSQQWAAHIGPADGKLEMSAGIIVKATFSNDK